MGPNLKRFRAFSLLTIFPTDISHVLYHFFTYIVIGSAVLLNIQSYHHLSCEFESRSWRGVLDTTLCDKVCKWLATGRWVSPGTSVSSSNKTDCHDMAEILLTVALSTITYHGKLEFTGRTFRNRRWSIKINFISTDNVCTLCLSCNGKKSKSTVKYYWKKQKQS